MMIHATKIQRCFEYAKLLGKKGEQHPLRMLLLAVLFKIALHYETSIVLVAFCFGSAFGMMTFRMRLNNGCQQRVQIAAKGYEQPDLYEFFAEWWQGQLCQISSRLDQSCKHVGSRCSEIWEIFGFMDTLVCHSWFLRKRVLSVLPYYFIGRQ